MKKRKANITKVSGQLKGTKGNGQESDQQKEQQKNRGLSKGAIGAGQGNGAYDSEDENEGFGNWLRSSDGVAYMRLFVVANSLLVFMTMSWSHVWQVVDIVREVVGL